jgi:hypothetical protein
MSSHLRPPESDVVLIAEHFGISAESCSRTGGGFSGATIYRVTSGDQQQYAVRCTPLDLSLAKERLQVLHQLLFRMQQAGLQTVAVPLRHCLTRDIWQPEQRANNIEATSVSETMLQLHGNVWQMEPWLPGEAVLHSPTTAQLRSALQKLSEFHRSAAAQIRPEPVNDWFTVAMQNSPGVLRRRGISRELSSGLLNEFRRRFMEESDPEFRELALRVCSVLDRWLPWLSSRLENLAQCQFRLQPVIRDLWSAHVLFADDEVSGLIDLSSMSTDHVCFDISRLFRSWFGASRDRLHEAVGEFAKVGPLDSAERQLLQGVDAATVLLSPVTWLRRRLTEGNSLPADITIITRLNELTIVAEQFEPL